MANSDLVVKVAGDTEAFRESLAGLSEKVLEWVGELNPLVAGAVGLIAGIGIAAVEVAKEYEEATNEIISKTGATGDSLKGLQEDFDSVFKADGAHNAKEIADAIAEVNVRLGLTGEPLQAASKGFLDLADNLHEQVEPLLTNTSKAMNAFGISADDATKFQDKLLVVTQATGANLTELTGTLAQGQPILKQWGLSVDESATLLGTLQKAGVDGSTVIAALGKAIKVLPEGIAPSKDAFLGLIDGIKNAGTESESTQQSIALFGKSGVQMAQVIRDGKIDIDSLADSLANSAGAVETMDSKTDSFSEKLTTLYRTVSSVLEPLGSGLIEAGKGAVDMLTGLFNGTGALSEGFKSLTTFLAPMIDTFQTHLLPVLKDIGSFVAGFLINAFGGLVDILKVLWNPILTTGIDLFQKYLLPAINAVYDGIGKLVGVLKNIPGFDQVFKSGADAIDALTPKTKEASDATGGLETAHKGLADTLNTKSHPALIDIAGAVKNAKDAKELLTKATEAVKGAESDLSAAYKDVHIPTLTDLQTAIDSVALARTNVTSAAVALKASEDALNTITESKSTPNAKTLKAALDDVDQKRKDLKATTDFLKQSEKDLTDTQAANQKAITDLAGADKEYTTAINSLHIPAIKNYQDALEDVQTAKDDVRTSADNLKAAEDALAQLIAQKGVKSAQDIKTAEDDLGKARLDLKSKTDTLKQSEGDLQKSEAALKGAEAEYLAGNKALTDYWKNSSLPASKNLSDAIATLRTAVDNARTAATTLKTAEDALKAAHDAGNISVADLKTKTDDANEARKQFTTATQAQSDAEKILAGDFGVSNQAILAIKSSTDLGKQATLDMNAALSTLGIDSSQHYATLATNADNAYKAILASGLANSSQLRLAQIADLQAQEDKWVSMGTAVPADQQLMLASLTQQQKDWTANNVTSWGTMWGSIHDATSGFFKALNDDIITGDFSHFKEQAIKGLEDIGKAVLDKMTKPATDAISTFVADSIGALLSGKGLGGVMDSLTKIGTSMANIFNGTSGALGTGVGVAGQAGSTAAGAAGSAGSAASGAAGSAGSAGSSAATGMLGTVASVTGIVTGVISAGAAVYGDAVMTNIKDCLNDMRNDTKYNSWVWDQGGGHEALLDIKNNIDNYLSAFGGWYHDSIVTSMGTAEESRDRIKDMSLSLTHLDTYVNQMSTVVPSKLDAISAAIMSMPAPITNVKVTLDGADIAAHVESQVEKSVRQAIAV